MNSLHSDVGFTYKEVSECKTRSEQRHAAAALFREDVDDGKICLCCFRVQPGEMPEQHSER